MYSIWSRRFIISILSNRFNISSSFITIFSIDLTFETFSRGVKLVYSSLTNTLKKNDLRISVLVVSLLVISSFRKLFMKVRLPILFLLLNLLFTKFQNFLGLVSHWYAMLLCSFFEGSVCDHEYIYYWVFCIWVIWPDFLFW